MSRKRSGGGRVTPKGTRPPGVKPAEHKAEHHEHPDYRHKDKAPTESRGRAPQHHRKGGHRGS